MLQLTQGKKMDDTVKLELVAAIRLLVESPNAHLIYETMRDTAPMIARHPNLQLTGEAATLNTLARFKSAKPDVYATVMELVASKREAIGLPPLESAASASFDKAAYMQQFMEEKRLRERRAVAIENMQRSERDRLVGRIRLDFMQRQSAMWKAERDAFLERAREAAKPKRLTRADISLAVESFWNRVDKKLDELEVQAKTGSRNVISSASLSELDAALRNDPYKK